MKNIQVKGTQLHFTLCHRKPERSFFWKGKQFPVCARCTGIHIGYLTFPLFLFSILTWNIWLTIALMLPTIMDGLIQAFGKWESKNWIRVSTGLASGVGAMSFISILGKFIGDQIILLFS